jgi:hypothetical protein
MTDSPESADAPFDDDSVEEVDGVETAESIAEEVRDEIRLGHVEDDVSHVLEERFDEAGIELRPEAVDDLAEEIEKDVSS